MSIFEKITFIMQQIKFVKHVCGGSIFGMFKQAFIQNNLHRYYFSELFTEFIKYTKKLKPSVERKTGLILIFLPSFQPWSSLPFACTPGRFNTTSSFSLSFSKLSSLSKPSRIFLSMISGASVL